MKKTFRLESAKHKPERVVDSIKHDIRKYLKRERRRELPAKVDYWDFDCRAGQDSESSVEVHVGDIIKAVDNAFEKKWPSVYIEILAKEAVRPPRAPKPEASPFETLKSSSEKAEEPDEEG